LRWHRFEELPYRHGGSRTVARPPGSAVGQLGSVALAYPPAQSAAIAFGVGGFGHELVQSRSPAGQDLFVGEPDGDSGGCRTVFEQVEGLAQVAAASG